MRITRIAMAGVIAGGIGLPATATVAEAAAPKEVSKDIIAVQIRKQGFACENPESATRDPEAAKTATGSAISPSVRATVAGGDALSTRPPRSSASTAIGKARTSHNLRGDRLSRRTVPRCAPSPWPLRHPGREAART